MTLLLIIVSIYPSIMKSRIVFAQFGFSFHFTLRRPRRRSIDTQDKLRKLMEDNGYRVAVLEQKVPTEKREE